MIYFSNLRKHHKNNNNPQNCAILLLVTVSVVTLFGLSVLVTVFAATNAVFAQQQDDNGEGDRAVLWVDVKDFISSGTTEDISAAIQSTLPSAESSYSSTF